MDRDDDPKGISFDYFLDHKPVIDQMIQHVDLGNAWIVFGLVLVLEKRKLDQLLNSPNFSDKFVEIFEQWLNTTSIDGKRQLLENLRGHVLKPFAEYEKKLMGYEASSNGHCTDEKSELKRNLETKNQEIDHLKVSAQEKDEEMKGAKERIQELEKSLSLVSADMNKMKKNLETKIQETDKLKVSAQEKDEEMKGAKERIKELEESLSSASTDINKLKISLETKIQEINDLMVSAQEKDEEAKAKIEELEGSLSLASDEKSELKRNLETKIQEIDDLKVSIKEKDNESDSKIRELQSIIHEKEEELLSSQQLLKRKEKEVNTLSEGITVKEIESASFRKLSEEQVQEIVALKLKLTDKQKDIAEKESVIKSTNEELLSVRQLLADNQQDIAEKESVIKSINEELSSVRLLLSHTQEELKLQRNELEEKLKTQHRISKMKDREIEGLKAMLYPRNEQDMITSIKWSESEVRLTSPSAEQCTDVLTRIDNNHRQIYLSDSSSDVAQLLIVPLLQKKSVSSLYIFSTPLRHDFIDLFSSKMLDNNTLESLYLNHNSIDDDGVITLVQSLKHNKKLQYLSLEFNTEITSLSVPSLAEFIRIDSTLSVLYVASTSIDAKGVLELVDSLKFNKRLGKIVVDHKHKAICSQFVGKTNRLDFSYSSTTAYENTGITKF
ncbi:PREDICTED: uncharacterized protein PFB0145c-like [Amphimedon queenslandica]|uniref:Death domain-containing protein n=2 Tax=Amphimedon queenslandica TaxID=400682 RepID=A0AAN0JUK2_AMPQE|nr:PREDICTED: uncharacterized protein PFB0145c-like [Amphimedon queenslandica]|eukprot:XP_019860544.1 PREDICTED: uncharacterized protein PFB0145c-like [Amphimedon queenslandica]